MEGDLDLVSSQSATLAKLISTGRHPLLLPRNFPILPNRVHQIGKDDLSIFDRFPNTVFLPLYLTQKTHKYRGHTLLTHRAAMHLVAFVPNCNRRTMHAEAARRSFGLAGFSPAARGLESNGDRADGAGTGREDQTDRGGRNYVGSNSQGIGTSGRGACPRQNSCQSAKLIRVSRPNSDIPYSPSHHPNFGNRSF